MAEHQLPKLNTRVRFPSSAPPSHLVERLSGPERLIRDVKFTPVHSAWWRRPVGCDLYTLPSVTSLGTRPGVQRRGADPSMAAEIPYLMSVSNLGAILTKIQSAGTPPRFTHEFLKSNLGFSSSNDRAVIKLLKQLGFLTNDGTPTDRYNAYRGPNPGTALADGLREGWEGFFLSDEKIYTRSTGEIQGIAKNVTGAGDAVAMKMASTFKTLSDLADFNSAPHPQKESNGADEVPTNSKVQPKPDFEPPRQATTGGGLLTLNHDIHLHLPATSDVSVYRAILQAIKSELM